MNAYCSRPCRHRLCSAAQGRCKEFGVIIGKLDYKGFDVLKLGKPEQQALVGVSQPPYAADDSIVLQGVGGGRVAVLVVDLQSVFEVGGGRCEV